MLYLKAVPLFIAQLYRQARSAVSQAQQSSMQHMCGTLQMTHLLTCVLKESAPGLQGWGQFVNLSVLIVLLLIFNSSGKPPYSHAAAGATWRVRPS